MRVDVEGESSFVLKQARERLRTKAHWVSRLDRIWTERAALELLAGLLPDGWVPRVVFAETDDYLFAMTCAPDDSVVWKEQLLAGEADEAVARRAGSLLGAIHAETVGHPGLARFADLEVFDQLRIEPFYRTIVRVHPALAPRVGALIASMASAPVRCFVHADFSPKNILVHKHGLTLVDFETAHAGDPAYDLGFVLSHLLLKAIRAAPHEARYLALTRAFWEAYRERTSDRIRDDDLEHRANAHAAACALSRVDGTSPVDYLDEPRQQLVRRFTLAALAAEPASWSDLIETLARELRGSTV
jgi:5-methylthioribose kinase